MRGRSGIHFDKTEFGAIGFGGVWFILLAMAALAWFPHVLKAQDWTNVTLWVTSGPDPSPTYPGGSSTAGVEIGYTAPPDYVSTEEDIDYSDLTFNWGIGDVETDGDGVGSASVSGDSNTATVSFSGDPGGYAVLVVVNSTYPTYCFTPEGTTEFDWWGPSGEVAIDFGVATPTFSASMSVTPTAAGSGTIIAAGGTSVDIGSASISVSSSPSVPLGTVAYSVGCSVQYKASASASYTSVPDGTSVTATASADDPTTFEIDGVFPVAGYYAITLSGSAFGADILGDGIDINPVPGGPFLLSTTAASATIFPNPIKTGFALDGTDIKVPVLVTVSPPDQASNVTIDPGGDAAIDTSGGGAAIQVNADGTMRFNLTGTNATDSHSPNGDAGSSLVAKIGSVILASMPVIVEVPNNILPEIGFDSISTGASAQNACLNPNTVPADSAVDTSHAQCVTLYGITQPIVVVNQFGQPVSALYWGANVTETNGQTWVNINQTVGFNATYSDTVSFAFPNPISTAKVVAFPSDDATNWTNANGAGNAPITFTVANANISVNDDPAVKVAGWIMSPGFDNPNPRTLTLTSDSSSPPNVTVSVNWPAPPVLAY